MVDVAPGTIVVFSDPGCPWAHASIHRILVARAQAGLDGTLVLDHRCFPLEVMNRRATPKRILDAELPVAGALAPDAGWEMWQDDAFAYPVTTLPAMEAVQAAKVQSLAASEQLDSALRRAFFGQSRCISLRHVILDVAEKCDAVDAVALQDALDDGTARRAVLDQAAEAEASEVQGSPHFFVAGGFDVHNPGVEIRWEGRKGVGFPIVTKNDPNAFDDILRRAAGAGT